MNKFIIRLSFFGFSLFLLSMTSFAYQPAGLNSVSRPDQNELWRLGSAYSQIKQFYVKDSTDKKLFEGAIRGMVQALDPHSVYLDEEMMQGLKEQTNGKFVGIGVQVTTEDHMVKVISPIDGTPAAKAGIKAGDYIIAVNGKPIIDMPITKVVKLIRGKPGTSVVLTIANKNEKKTKDLTITRKIVNVKSVKSRMLADGFGYVRISMFQQKTGRKTIEAVNKLRQENGKPLKGVVIDLRNDPGGLLDAAVQVVDTFLDSNKLGKDKTIVYTKGRIKQAIMRLKASPGDLLNGAPIVVLINQGSASGSEIVAGALQDYKRAVIVGEKSFGKGSVQTVLPLDDKTGIKLTTALYYTPKGRSIQATGIKPDIWVFDFKLNKEKEDALFFSKVREAQLRGHLANTNGDKAAKDKKERLNAAKLAEEDYQLHTALKILKALAVVHKLQPGNDA